MQQQQGSTISELRRIQSQYETKIFGVIDQLDSYAIARGPEYKECEQIAKHAAKMCSRWKRLTSLTVEALVELDHEITTEQTEQSLLEESRQEYEAQLVKEEEECSKLQNLVGLIQHFVTKAENQRGKTSQQNLQQQLQVQRTPFNQSMSQSGSFVGDVAQAVGSPEPTSLSAFSQGFLESNGMMYNDNLSYHSGVNQDSPMQQQILQQNSFRR